MKFPFHFVLALVAFCLSSCLQTVEYTGAGETVAASQWGGHSRIQTPGGFQAEMDSRESFAEGAEVVKKGVSWWGWTELGKAAADAIKGWRDADLDEAKDATAGELAQAKEANRSAEAMRELDLKETELTLPEGGGAEAAGLFPSP